MKVLGILIVLVVALIGGTWFYAKKLPSEILQTQTIRIQGDIPTTWNKIIDAKNYSSWRNGMRAVMPVLEDSLGLKKWKEVYARNVILATRISTYIPDSLMIEFIPEERNFSTTWIWKLEPIPPDSVSITLISKRTLGAPLFRLSSKIFGTQDELQERALKDLASGH